MSDGIAEMNKSKTYTHTDGKVYVLDDKEIHGQCKGCEFFTAKGLCGLILAGIRETCDDRYIYKLQSPLATASADLAAQGKPLVAGGKPYAGDPAGVRMFETGATRSPDVEDNGEIKHDLLGFFSPLVTKRRAEFMNKHRKQTDGVIRDGDNWKKGMPFVESFRSLKRHVLDMELLYEGYDAREGDIEEHICAAMFNLESLLLTRLQEKIQ